MGKKIDKHNDKNQISSFSYKIKQETYSSLSTYRKNDPTVRMRTEYFPKPPLHSHDNEVPGPGSCKYHIESDSLRNTIKTGGSYSKNRKKGNSTFGVG